jgi:hypothetical protein
MTPGVRRCHFLDHRILFSEARACIIPRREGATYGAVRGWPVIIVAAATVGLHHVPERQARSWYGDTEMWHPPWRAARHDPQERIVIPEMCSS